jgi:cysteine-rich repeat protein
MLGMLGMVGLFGVLSPLACWTGEDSSGLPCENNSHCGLGLDCINSYCGGEPSETLCGNGYLDPNEACDDGEQNADNGACRLDCTTQACGDGVQGPAEACDLGEQNDNLGACKTDCTPEICGDSFKGPTEACDDNNTQDGDGCSSACTLETCGNGVVDPGEACDDGMESATCDDDCTEVVCGDTNINEAAGEDCDDEVDPVDDHVCMSNCTIPLMYDDMEPSTPAAAWSHEPVSGNVPDNWLVGPRNALGNAQGGTQRAWDSGLPAGMSGDTRLKTPVIDLGPLTGETLELRFDHARVLSDCMDLNIAYEGGVVEISVDGGPFTVITPDDGYPSTVGDGLCMLSPSPLNGQKAFSLDVDFTTETVDLSDYAGSSIQLAFRVAWDCGNCTQIEHNQNDRGWFIDNVVVWRK